jgi:hypothetical protein
MTDHWRVVVWRNGEELIDIESACYGGKADLSEADLQAIRQAGENLLAFAGKTEGVLGLSPEPVDRETAEWLNNF